MDGKKNDLVRYFIFVILFLPAFLMAHASHLFEIGFRAGMANEDALCHYVSSIPGFHGGMQLGYAYHSSYVIGFRIASTLERCQTGYSKTDYTDTYSVIDVENVPMQVDYAIGRLNETYTTWSVGIPVQLGLSKNNFSFYIGPKFVFPFDGRWIETAENAALSVYYPLQNNRVYTSFPLAASPAFRASQKGEINSLPKVQYWLAMELGYDFLVHTGQRTKSYLSIGIYFDYSFSSIQDKPSDRTSLLMLSDTRDGFPLQRILTPVMAAQRQGKRLVSSSNPYTIGIKIAYRIAPYKSHQETYRTCRCYGIEYY